jgi:nucleotide-binding universal stress UspA family protein
MDREGLADFLRRRREALHPEDVGLHPGRRRRTAGLRREEVALLAHMSTDFYARLEQQRGSRPSEQTVGALARALRLTQDERDHLFQLAGHNAPPRGFRSDHVTPALLRVLDRLDTPAQVVSDLGVVLVQNPLAEALLGVQSHHTGLARSVFYRWFTDPAERERWPEADHAMHSRNYAASLRVAHGRDPQGRPAAGRRAARAQPGVRGAVGAPRGRSAHRHPQARRPPGGRPARARLPDPHRRESDGAARRLHRRARQRGRREARDAVGDRHADLRHRRRLRVMNAIVVGTDGSTGAEAAIQKVIELANGSGATVHLVCAYPGRSTLERIGLTAKADPVDLRGVAHDIVSREEHRFDGLEFSVEKHVREGDPANTILDVAEEQDADLIVIGAGGTPGHNRAMTGSVASKLAHHAQTSLLIVR